MWLQRGAKISEMIELTMSGGAASNYGGGSAALPEKMTDEEEREVDEWSRRSWSTLNATLAAPVRRHRGERNPVGSAESVVARLLTIPEAAAELGVPKKLGALRCRGTRPAGSHGPRRPHRPQHSIGVN